MFHKPLINNQIRAREVRVIDETGKQLGVVSLEEALRLAQERNLDLIQVTEKVDPPVCKIGDYGKYLYQEEKKSRSIKKQSGGETKVVRLTFNISQHDLETKAHQAEKFLGLKDRVVIEMQLRGREKALQDYARNKMLTFVEILQAKMPIKVERDIKREGRGLSMIIIRG